MDIKSNDEYIELSTGTIFRIESVTTHFYTCSYLDVKDGWVFAGSLNRTETLKIAIKNGECIVNTKASRILFRKK